MDLRETRKRIKRLISSTNKAGRLIQIAKIFLRRFIFLTQRRKDAKKNTDLFFLSLCVFASLRETLFGSYSNKNGRYRCPDFRRWFPTSRIQHPGSRNGFTLTELLVVIAIIITLVGLTIGIASYVNRSAIERQIKMEIAAMETALEVYKADMGAYPPLDSGSFNILSTNFTNTTVYAKIIAGQTDGCINTMYVYRALAKGNKVYWKVPNRMMTTGYVVNASIRSAVNIILIDPLGRPYGYNPRYPVANPSSFDLFSVGIDGKCAYPANLSEIVDDIGNWKR